MAQTILSVAEKLALITWNEADFLSGVPRQSESLQNKIRLMRSALVDASEKSRNIKEVEEWLNQVTDAVMEAEDVIDLSIVRAERLRRRGILTRYILYPSLLFNLHKLGNKIEDSNKKIEQLSAMRSMLGLATAEAGQSSNEQHGQLLPFHRRAELGLPFRGRDSVEEFCVIGFQEEEKEVVERLMTQRESARRSPAVVSIVGMGGSGKTTLARKVYKCLQVTQHYQARAWVCVSQQFLVKDILLVIKEQIQSLQPDDKEQDEGKLIERLWSLLEHKTYLIVFDDLWRPEHWEKLKQALPVQHQHQSKVLVTTRNEAVARHADPSTDIYHQRLLAEDDSWKLFLAKVTMGSTDAAALQDDLVELGREIVSKCHGLPLAIVLLGGLLSTKPKSRRAWSKVLDSVKWVLNENEAGVSCNQVLRLSYTDLPDLLKPCFLYVGAFPEDYEIECSRLIWLWVAEGFIKPRDQLTMEDVAEEYIEELAQRSMIQITVRNYDGRGLRCRIHDLVHDLAASEANQQRFLQVNRSNSCRRLSLTPDWSPTSNALNQGNKAYYIHSVLYFSTNFYWGNSWKNWKLLRILDLQDSCTSLVELPMEIGKLIFLKYLSLRGNVSIHGLPSSIGDLQNLQTLDLRKTGLRDLPMTMIKLQQLRNLVFSRSYLGQSMSIDTSPDLLQHNVDLQKLMLNEGKWIVKLEKLTNLRELTILFDGRPFSYEESLINAIPKLNRLRSFKLIAMPCRKDNDDLTNLATSFAGHSDLYNMVLMRVVRIRDFPPNLTTLFLQIPTKPGRRPLLEKLKMLRSLRCLFLYGSPISGSNVTLSFADDGFHQLEELILIDIDDLEFCVEEGAIPNLRVLKLISCYGLKRIPQELKQVVTTLKELVLLGISTQLELRVRNDVGEDWGMIKHIPILDVGSDFSDILRDLRLWFETDVNVLFD